MNCVFKKYSSLPVVLALCFAAQGYALGPDAVSVCNILSDPAQYAGETVTIQGSVLFVPPHVPLQLLGPCNGNIAVILPGMHDKFVKDELFKEFMADIWKYHKGTMDVLLEGKIRTNRSSGVRVNLYLKSVKAIHITP